MTKRTREKADAVRKAKIALEVSRAQATAGARARQPLASEDLAARGISAILAVHHVRVGRLQRLARGAIAAVMTRRPCLLVSRATKARGAQAESETCPDPRLPGAA